MKMTTMTLSPTASHIINLFNHSLSVADRREISVVLSKVKCGNYFDKRAQDVMRTLSEKVRLYHVPYCSERQALALAYAIDGPSWQTHVPEVEDCANTKAPLTETKEVAHVAPGGITVGNRVEFVDTDSGEWLCYTIVHQNETDLKSNRLAIDTPIGSCLAGHIAGTSISVKTPGGERHFLISNITK